MAVILTTKIEKIQTEFRAAVKQTDEKVAAANSRLLELESRANRQSDQITIMQAGIDALKKELAVLRDRCEDYEQRSRRFNLRV